MSMSGRSGRTGSGSLPQPGPASGLDDSRPGCPIEGHDVVLADRPHYARCGTQVVECFRHVLAKLDELQSLSLQAEKGSHSSHIQLTIEPLEVPNILFGVLLLD